jgi:hypothetical protein
MANAFLSRLLSRPEALELRARFDGIIILDERIHARAQDLYEGACGWNDEGERIEAERKASRFDSLGFDRLEPDREWDEQDRYEPAWAQGAF